jgi:hypothetical protein
MTQIKEKKISENDCIIKEIVLNKKKEESKDFLISNWSLYLYQTLFFKYHIKKKTCLFLNNIYTNFNRFKNRMFFRPDVGCPHVPDKKYKSY